MAKRANLCIYQGDDYCAAVNIFNADGTPADLTGYTARAQIRQQAADLAPQVIAELTVTIELPNIISLALSHTTTKTLMKGYVWDLELVDAVGTVTTVLAGDVVVTLEVTRVTPPAALRVAV